MSTAGANGFNIVLLGTKAAGAGSVAGGPQYVGAFGMAAFKVHHHLFAFLGDHMKAFIFTAAGRHHPQPGRAAGLLPAKLYLHSPQIVRIIIVHHDSRLRAGRGMVIQAMRRRSYVGRNAGEGILVISVRTAPVVDLPSA